MRDSRRPSLAGCEQRSAGGIDEQGREGGGGGGVIRSKRVGRRRKEGREGGRQAGRRENKVHALIDSAETHPLSSPPQFDVFSPLHSAFHLRFRFSVPYSQR